MKLPKIEELIQKSRRKWQDCSQGADKDLLRLVLLREMIRGIHAEKSRCLGTGLKEEAKGLKDFESKVERLREAGHFSDDLEALIQGGGSISKKSHFLPEGLFRSVEREKFDRYDRKWESAIASFQKARTMSHNAPEPAYHLGICYLQLGKIEQAKAAFNQAIKINHLSSTNLNHVLKLLSASES
jgi:tetratricopeptide (TPR) repeat protein